MNTGNTGNTGEWLEDYFRRKLLSNNTLREYIERSSVVTVELDEGIVYDLMVIMPDDLFTKEFSCQFRSKKVRAKDTISPLDFTTKCLEIKPRGILSFRSWQATSYYLTTSSVY